ncbi:hypothetical protein DAPPUDRAFT_228995 [Daphnia pulex]|uniref:Innexin n=1 Tax=Daphnia pulex TaxID=6669 RepID=E9HJ63_DAPPU|nr:hypothetical protein DAPPUDRAFT_228995 [Daphnia pulex]|eukprot:EFX68186.1 hypothetical protein DAPPUDRAFT_228995 [Daphnia pulex]
MLAELSTLKGIVKVDVVKIDSNIFRCHYKLTVIVLTISAMLISLKQYVGDPIDCIINAEKSPVESDVLDNYCWIHSTHTLPNQPGMKTNGSRPIPGLGTPQEGEQMIYHKYYQWVGFFLIFEAITFFIPRLVWKFSEGGRMRTLLEDLRFSPVETPEQKNAKASLVDYLFTNVCQHQVYASSYFVCEALNAIIILGNIFLVDAFLGGEFLEYGGNVVAASVMDPEDRIDPMSYVFPKLTKCLFKMYGPSGTIQQYDALCILPVNILNEKVFIFLWFWYVILAILTGIDLVVRGITLLFPRVRLFFLKRQAGRNIDFDHVETVFRRCQIGDWFVLMLISSNINQWTFQEILRGLALKFRGKDI